MNDPYAAFLNGEKYNDELNASNLWKLRQGLDTAALTHHSELAKMHDWNNKDVISIDNRALFQQQSDYYKHLTEYFNGKKAKDDQSGNEENISFLRVDYQRHQLYNLEIRELAEPPLSVDQKWDDLFQLDPLPDNLAMFRAKLLSKSDRMVNSETKCNILHTLIEKLSILDLENGEEVKNNWELAVKYKIYIDTVCQTLLAEELRALLQQKNLAGLTPVQLYYKNCSYDRKAEHYNVNINGVFLSSTILNYSHEIYFKNDNQYFKHAWNIAYLSIIEMFCRLVGKKLGASTKVPLDAAKDVVQNIKIANDAMESSKHAVDQLNAGNETGYEEAHKIDLKDKILIGVTGRNNYSWIFGPISNLDLKKNINKNSKAFNNINSAIYSQDDLHKQLGNNKLTQHEKFIALHVLTRRKIELETRLEQFNNKKGIWGLCVRRYYSNTIKTLKQLKVEVTNAHQLLSEHFKDDLEKVVQAGAKEEDSLERLLQIKLALYGWIPENVECRLKDKSNTALNKLSSSVKSVIGADPKSTITVLFSSICAASTAAIEWGALRVENLYKK